MSKRNKKKALGGETQQGAAHALPLLMGCFTLAGDLLNLPSREGTCTNCGVSSEPVGDALIDPNGKPKPVCSYCLNGFILWPKVHPSVTTVANALKDRVAYHGTASLFLPDILDKGLLPQRKSGVVYFSPLEYRAKIYANSWAVGMHAGGATESPSGSVVSFSILDDDILHQEQHLDFGVFRSVSPTEVTEESRVAPSDLSEMSGLPNLSQDTPEYMGYLRNFIGIAGWSDDAYRRRNPFAKVLRHARECYDHLEKTVSVVVRRRRMFVPEV